MLNSYRTTAHPISSIPYTLRTNQHLSCNEWKGKDLCQGAVFGEVTLILADFDEALKQRRWKHAFEAATFSRR